MNAIVTRDFARFDETVLPFLAQDPVRNTVLLTVLDMVRAGSGYDDADPWFAWVENDGDTVGVALRTPPYHIALSGMGPEAAQALGTHLSDSELPGAFGDIETVAMFAQAAGRSHRISMDEVQHLLTELSRPPAVTGQARPFTGSDADLYVRWDRDFADEAGVRRSANPLGSLRSRVDTGGGLRFWEVDGTPVSMCGRSGAVCGVPRIGPLWTPPEHRRHGYAAAVTAYVCAEALASGADACTLFADAANATANAVYERLGFRRVARTVEAEFEPA